MRLLKNGHKTFFFYIWRNQAPRVQCPVQRHVGIKKYSITVILTYMSFSRYLMSKLRRMPASLRSPRRIMSSTPWMEVGCIGLMFVAFWGEIQCSWRERGSEAHEQLLKHQDTNGKNIYCCNSHLDRMWSVERKQLCHCSALTFPSSSSTWICPESQSFTTAPTGTSNSRPVFKSNQT